MPSLHMPLQSGSDRVLKAMRRSYRSEKFLGIIDTVRAAIPDAAITTDLIVGFPGETEADFAETLRVVEASRFSSAFTFQYSIRPGTPAATMEHQVPKAVVQERFERLIELQERVSWAENRTVEGREVEVLVAPGEGRKDGATARLSGRARDNRLVHFAVPEGAERPRPGDVVTVGVTYGAPHHLVADSGVQGGAYAVRRTPGGDAWAALQDAAVPGKPAVSLGMPSIGASGAGRGVGAGLLRLSPSAQEVGRAGSDGEHERQAGRHARDDRVALGPVGGLVLLTTRGTGRGVERGRVERFEVERRKAASCVGHQDPFRQGRESASTLRSDGCPCRRNGATLAERPRPLTVGSGASVASGEAQGWPTAPSAFTCAWSTCSAYLPPVALSTASPPRSMAWSLNCSTWSGWSSASC